MGLFAGRNASGSAKGLGAPLTGIDLVLADLDGVVYRGQDAIPYAVDSLNLAQRTVKLGYITNNASRTDQSVAEHLCSLGLTVAASEVVTSPQAAMRLLNGLVPSGGSVLVIGGSGISTEVTKAGFRVVDSADDKPDAVVQGFSPNLGWKDLAEAAFALKLSDPLNPESGIPWIATNMDWTIPVARGIAPGNGTLVSAVHTAVGRMPLVAGKPEVAIFETAAARFDAHNPLFIGDRLDTDILGANRAEMVSALVLTGVDGPKQLLAAPEDSRPRYILSDLRQLHEPYPVSDTDRKGTVRVRDAVVRLNGTAVDIVRGSGVDLLRAACQLIWNAPVSIHALTVPPQLLIFPPLSHTQCQDGVTAGSGNITG